MASYAEVYARWRNDPEGYWLDAARAIDWERAPTRALDASAAPLYRWYPDTVCNTCWNAVDRHVAAGHAARLAIIHNSPMTGTVTRITYGELLERVARFAGALTARGVVTGDRVIIYMPMVPEAAGRHARLRADRGGPLRGLRRVRGARARDPYRRRAAEGDRGRRRAGSSRGGWWPTSRWWTRRSGSRRTSPRR